MSQSFLTTPTIQPAFMRQTSAIVVSNNEREVLDLVRRNGEISRASITRATSLTAQSVSRLVEGLMDRGFLKMGKAVAQGRGQPSPPIKLNPDAAYSVGISIMTDAVTAALMNFGGDVIGEAIHKLESTELDHILEVIEHLSEHLIEKHVRNRKRVFGIGVGVTGYFIGEAKRVNPPDPLGELAFVDLDQIINERLNLPVWIDNDGNVAAMGESLAGVGHQFDTFAYIYFSKGIGGSLVINRRMFPGAFGNAGEFAGILPSDTHKDRPTLELLRQMLNRNGQDLQDLNELIEQYDPNWPGVNDWIDRIKPHLQAIISAITAVIDPEAIVLGGRMPQALANQLTHELYFQNVARRGKEKPVPKLVASEVTGDATAIGAAAAPFKAHFFI